MTWTRPASRTHTSFETSHVEFYELWEGAGDVPLIRSWACIVETTPDYSPIIDTLGPSQQLRGSDPCELRICAVARHRQSRGGPRDAR